MARIGFRGLYVAPFSKAWRRQVYPCNRQNSNQAFHKVNEIKSFLVSGSVNEFEMQGAYMYVLFGFAKRTGSFGLIGKSITLHLIRRNRNSLF